MIEWPHDNQVLQKPAVGSLTFTCSWLGSADTLRLKQGTTTLAESATGTFSASPGWYQVALVVGGAETHQINVGIGNFYVVAGQSNAYSPAEPAGYTAMASAPGRVSISDLLGKGPYHFKDAGVSTLAAGMSWIHTGNDLWAARGFPHGFCIIAVGATSTLDWRNTHRSRLLNALLRNYPHYPRAVLWHQGEADCTTPPMSGSTQNMIDMVSFVTPITPEWLIAKTSTCYPPPSGYSEWPIRAAQQHIIVTYQSYIRAGPDTDLLRAPGEVHFQGSGYATDHIKDVGKAWALNMLDRGV